MPGNAARAPTSQAIEDLVQELATFKGVDDLLANDLEQSAEPSQYSNVYIAPRYYHPKKQRQSDPRLLAALQRAKAASMPYADSTVTDAPGVVDVPSAAIADAPGVMPDVAQPQVSGDAPGTLEMQSIDEALRQAGADANSANKAALDAKIKQHLDYLMGSDPTKPPTSGKKRRRR